MNPKTHSLVFMLVFGALTLFMIAQAFSASARGSIGWLAINLIFALWNAHTTRAYYRNYKAQ